MTCNCRGFVRDVAVENKGESYPMSNHHPRCDEYELEEFVRVTLDGVSCIMEKGESYGLGDEYEIETVYLTIDQFENLPEFEGY